MAQSDDNYISEIVFILCNNDNAFVLQGYHIAIAAKLIRKQRGACVH